MMMKKGRRKESTGRRITKRTKAFQSFTLRKAQKSFTLLSEKLYFTLEKLYFTLKRLFAIESSSQLAFRLLLYLRKALLYSRKALLSLKRLFAIESSSKLAFRLLLYRSLRVHQAIAPGDLDRKDPLHFPASAQQHSFH